MNIDAVEATKQGPRRIRGRWILGACMAIVVCVAVAGFALFRASVPQQEGEVASPGLAHPVSIERDADGVPTIEALSRGDAAHALGYLHAQERFFQMDLLRRTAAGELSALVGVQALEQDTDNRLFRFRARAKAALAALPAGERAILDSYVHGVNEGLRSLKARPPEYLVLRQVPAPWTGEDSLLVLWSMYLTLQGDLLPRELARGWLADNSTTEQLAFMLPEASRFDAWLDAAPGQPADVAPLARPVAGPSWMGGPAGTESLTGAATRHRAPVGSNSWVVSGSRMADGRPVVSNDMHLPLGLPSPWYRAVMRFPSSPTVGALAGLTLPGLPILVVGSNGHLAWGFTNSYGDYLDLVESQADPSRPGQVRIAGKWQRPSVYEEIIHVRGVDSISVQVSELAQGPLLKTGGRTYLVRWTALEPGGVGMGMLAMEQAQRVVDALAIAPRAGIPAQNIVVADSGNSIGWTVFGALPARRATFTTTFPAAPDASPQWDGLLEPSAYPSLLDPVSGVIWTANNRQLGDERYERIGDGGADLGARAGQIAHRLAALRNASTQDVHDIMLDDEARFASLWRDQALRVLDASALQDQPERKAFRRLLADHWDGRAAVDSVSYRITRGFMYGVYDQLFAGLDEALAHLPGAPDFALASPRWPATVLDLLSANETAVWLPDGRTMQQVQLAAIDAVITELLGTEGSLDNATWGLFNALQLSHPLVEGVALVEPLLGAPKVPQAGDDHMPRIASPGFGQSQRMAISPGNEQQALFSMPGGQSGHPLSPHYLAGHDRWIAGSWGPLLPGPRRSRLVLTPELSPAALWSVSNR